MITTSLYPLGYPCPDAILLSRFGKLTSIQEPRTTGRGVEDSNETPDKIESTGVGEFWKLVLSSGILASMCCLPSVVLVMFGLASVSTAAALSDSLYWGPFRPILYTFTLIFIAIGLTMHFRNKGICTIEQAKKERRKIINISLLVVTASIIAYLIINYVILELLGIALGLPWKDDAFWN